MADNIHKAAQDGDLRAVKQYLAAGVHVDVSDEQQITALFWAAHGGHLRVVQHLLAKGADLEHKAPWGATPLIAAAEGGHLDVVDFLAKKGADMDARTDLYHRDIGYNAAFIATHFGHFNVVKYLDDRNCDIYATANDGTTSLTIAAFFAHLQILEYLLTRGVDVNLIDSDGDTAIHCVAGSSYYKCGADQLTAAQLLVKHGARVDGRNKKGETPADRVQNNDQLKRFLQQAARTTPQSVVLKPPQPCGSSSAAKLTGRVQRLHLEHKVEVHKPIHPNIKCIIDKLCCEYVSSLQLSADFFEPSADQCFCLHCHHARDDADSYPRGQPPQTYALPVGWTRFGLRLPPRAQHLGAIPKWHRAYHGTRAGSIEKILSTDLLAPPGSEVLGGANIKELPGHFDDDWKPKGFDTKQIFLSPSPKYAECYAPRTSFSASNKKIYQVRVALSVLVDPHSYKVGPETMGFREDGELCDERFSNDELEWATKQLGAIMFSGLLVKIE